MIDTNRQTYTTKFERSRELKEDKVTSLLHSRNEDLSRYTQV